MIPLRTMVSAVLVRPALALLAGMPLRHAERLPADGPAILCVNHNSHLDAPAVMSLYPLCRVHKLRPVVAAEYFFKGSLTSVLMRRSFGAIPIERNARCGQRQFLEACDRALAAGEILIIFPEGTRGEPERLAPFKSGIVHLAHRHRDVPVTPIHLRGFGRVLPKGAWLPVPHFCGAAVSQPLRWTGDAAGMIRSLEAAMQALERENPAGGPVTPDASETARSAPLRAPERHLLHG